MTEEEKTRLALKLRHEFRNLYLDAREWRAQRIQAMSWSLRIILTKEIDTEYGNDYQRKGSL